jgi:hypothetical protein
MKNDASDMLTAMGYPPIKKRWVEVKVDGEKRHMLLSEAQLEKIKNLQKVVKNG